jgi:hypothetical protein
MAHNIKTRRGVAPRRASDAVLAGKFERTEDTQSHSAPQVLPGVIRAELIGSDTCTALGFTMCAASPVLAMCRKLLAASYARATPLEVWRRDTLCLRVRALGEAACLEINAKGTGFIRHRAVRAAPPIAPLAWRRA